MLETKFLRLLVGLSFLVGSFGVLNLYLNRPEVESMVEKDARGRPLRYRSPVRFQQLIPSYSPRVYQFIFVLFLYWAFTD